MASWNQTHHPIQTQPSIPSSSSSSSSSSTTRSSINITSFPVAAISILGILTTGILLLSYYVFLIKCSRSLRRRRGRTLSFSTTSAAAAFLNKGLDHRAIDSLPTLRFTKTAVNVFLNAAHDCPVCLNDFNDGELLRLLPGCKHSFHIDCIDTWLQSNPNCPLCRREVVAHNILTFSDDAVINIDIEVVDKDFEESSEREARRIRKARKDGSMGDECINVREGKVEFVQPIRRSFSMDSCCDPQLYLSVQEIFMQKQHIYNNGAEGGSASGFGGGSDSSGGKSGRRSLFSFGHGRSSAHPV